MSEVSKSAALDKALEQFKVNKRVKCLNPDCGKVSVMDAFKILKKPNHPTEGPIIPCDFCGNEINIVKSLMELGAVY